MLSALAPIRTFVGGSTFLLAYAISGRCKIFHYFICHFISRQVVFFRVKKLSAPSVKRVLDLAHSRVFSCQLDTLSTGMDEADLAKT